VKVVVSGLGPWTRPVARVRVSCGENCRVCAQIGMRREATGVRRIKPLARKTDVTRVRVSCWSGDWGKWLIVGENCRDSWPCGGEKTWSCPDKSRGRGKYRARVRIPTQIGTHSAGKSTLVPIQIGTCSDANRHPCL